MEPMRDLVNTCVDECYARHQWNQVRRACNEAERLCERGRFFDCFAGPIPQAQLCEVIASNGTVECTPHARKACEEFDYDDDADVDLYDYSRWLRSQTILIDR